MFSRLKIKNSSSPNRKALELSTRGSSLCQCFSFGVSVGFFVNLARHAAFTHILQKAAMSELNDVPAGQPVTSQQAGQNPVDNIGLTTPRAARSAHYRYIIDIC